MKMKMVLMLMLVGCVDATNTRTAPVESCDTWVVGDPIMIWPPDHTMHRYSLDDCVTSTPECPTGYCGDGVIDPGEECDDGNDNPFDGCDTCRFVDTTPDLAPPNESSATGLYITSITSNESLDGSGDGHTIGDSVILTATTFELRAERGGGGNGRRYSVSFADARGETGMCTFYVAHDLGVAL